MNADAKQHIAIDSYTFCTALGPQEANRQLRQHWRTWVDEAQITKLALSGVETIRYDKTMIRYMINCFYSLCWYSQCTYNHNDSPGWVAMLYSSLVRLYIARTHCLIAPN